MSDRPKIIKQHESIVIAPRVTLDPDLSRLVGSMKAVLRRRYRDPIERQMAAQRIMQEMQAA